MIVKNEAKIIERLLSSAQPLMDCFCIHDTGSTDNTVELIEAFSKRTGITGTVHHHPFVNFAVNRTRSLNDAKEMADFILLLDADMQLVVDPLFQKSFLETADVFLIKQGNDNLQYSNVRIVRSSHAENYSGVTHEYLNVKSGRKVDTSLLFIHDVGDGGSKADKFTRDIKLLTQGIVDEPLNDRYHFYLANSYMDTNQFEKAIEMYEKRVGMGGWDEEVYYSMFKTSMAYKSLKMHDLFVQTAVKAWTFRPSRIESIYEVVKHCREQGQHVVARGFYNMVKGTKLPPDSLFVQKNVYDYALDYEYSLLAYYANDMAAYKVYKALFESQLNLYAQFNNYKFYAPILKGRSISLACEHAVTVNGKNHVMRGSTPSIVASKNGYVVNVRLVNYAILPSGAYDYLHGIVATENKRVHLNSALGVVKETVLKTASKSRIPQGWNEHLHGVEDVKLTRIDGDVVFTGTMAHADGRIGMCIGTYGNVLSPTELEMKSDCEKNWVFLPGRREMVYKWCPLQWGPLNGAALTIANTSSMPRMFEMARGSCNGVEFEKEWWFVVHFVHKHESELRFYYHSIVVFDDAMRLKRYTYPFKFSKTPIEYCLGMVVEPGRLLLTLSQNDASSQLLVVSRSDVDVLWM